MAPVNKPVSLGIRYLRNPVMESKKTAKKKTRGKEHELTIEAVTELGGNKVKIPEA